MEKAWWILCFINKFLIKRKKCVSNIGHKTVHILLIIYVSDENWTIYTITGVYIWYHSLSKGSKIKYNYSEEENENVQL